MSRNDRAQLVKTYYLNPSSENRKKLNTAFHKYFFALRFTKYIASLIKYSKVDYYRKVRKNQGRELDAA